MGQVERLMGKFPSTLYDKNAMGEFKGHISLALKSGQLFRSQFCVRFSATGF